MQINQNPGSIQGNNNKIGLAGSQNQNINNMNNSTKAGSNYINRSSQNQNNFGSFNQNNVKNHSEKSKRGAVPAQELNIMKTQKIVDNMQNIIDQVQTSTLNSKQGTQLIPKKILQSANMEIEQQSQKASLNHTQDMQSMKFKIKKVSPATIVVQSKQNFSNLRNSEIDIKKQIVKNQTKQGDLSQNNNVISATTGDIYRNEYLVSGNMNQNVKQFQTVNRSSHKRVRPLEKSKLNKSDISRMGTGIQSGNYQAALSRSPIINDQNGDNDYYFQQENLNQNQNEQQTSIYDESNVKVPGFLQAQENYESSDNKNKFYMTQVIQQNKDSNLNMTYGSLASNQKKGGPSAGSSSMKISKSQLKQYNQRKPVQTSQSKSHLMKSAQNRKQISPLNNKLQGEYSILEKYLANNDFTNYGMNNTQQIRQKKRSDLNASALVMNANQNIDYLNSTAPLNMTQINRLYNEEQMGPMLGLTDVVNSTQNLRRINSKESWKVDQNQQLNMSSLYYSGTLMNKNKESHQILTKGNTQNSVTPLKDQRKKQILIKNILMQDGMNNQKNKKYFLNLTLQQLIQQQKQASNENSSNLQYKGENSFENNQNLKSQKRLNKTLDNINNQSKVNMNVIQTEDNQDLRSFINNFIQGGQLPQNYTANLRDNSRQQNKSFSSSVNKFSNTMKISDFNNTQQIFETKQFPGNKKSKSSLKSTQNINFQDDGVITQSVIHNQVNFPQKYSALSTYSLNTTAQPTTTHGNQAKQRKVVSSKTGIQINAQSSKQIGQTKHKKKSSQDQDMIKMINFYQDDAISKFKNNDLKNKTFGAGLKTGFNAYQTQSKYKTNSTLNQYLSNTKSKQSQAQEQKQKTKPEVSNSFINLVYDQNQLQYVNATELGSYDYRGGINQFPNEKAVQKVSSKRTITQNQQRLIQKELAKSALLQDFNQQYQLQMNQYHPSAATQFIKNDFNAGSNPYVQKKTLAQQKKEQIREIQNKTQPIPKQLLEMAQAEAINFSTGTSIILNKQPSKESTKSKPRQPSNLRATNKQNEDCIALLPTQIEKQNRQVKDDKPSQIYNNKNTVILDEVNSRDQDSLQELDSESDSTSKLDRFILGKQIGQGAYAVVRVATLKKTGKKYAIKVYDKSKLTDTNRQRSVRREIKLLQKMNHQNIVKIYEAFETENHVYLVMEYVGGDNLYSYLKQHKHSRLDEKEAKRIFKQLLTALQYCHRKSIAHRDIKLENILLDDDKNVKLIDFGFSTCIPNDKKIKMFCGTPSYMAPEIVNKEEYAGPPADIWASGVLLYALMNGKFPFRGDTDKDLYRRINRGTFEIHNSLISQHLINFLSKMVNTIADERLSAEDLLQDEWFKVEVEQSLAQNEKLKQDFMSDQRKNFKAKIMSKIPVERTKNTICLVSSNEKLSNSKPLGGITQLNANNQNQNTGSNFRQNQNVNDQSDYGNTQTNQMRRLNQEAYQAYYNTSGGSYGQNANNVSNPYYNNFFAQNNNNSGNGFNGFQNNQGQGFYPNFQNQNRSSPSKGQGMNINTNPQVFPINFTQQPPNQIGTPQVFGSPTGFHCTANMINNNFNIINNITQVTCLPQPTPDSNINSQDNKSNPSAASSNQARDTKEKTELISQVQQNQQSDFDDEIIESITQMGYHKSHVVSQLDCDTSNIATLYNKLKEEKMSMTQNRPLSLQPHGRRMQYGLGGYLNQQNYAADNLNHNNGVFQQNFIPSITDSLKGTGDNETSGEYTQMCNPTIKHNSHNNIRLQNLNNTKNIKLLNNNYTDYDYENDNSSGTGEYQYLNSGSNTFQNINNNNQQNLRENYSPKIVSLNSSDL